MSVDLGSDIDVTAERPHGELDCADMESLLASATVENGELRAQNGIFAAAADANLAEIESLRHEMGRLRALLREVSDKADIVASERDSLQVQVDVLTQEYMLAEKAATPEGTLLFAALPDSLVTSTYRQVSRIRRGPLPPVVRQEVVAARADVVAAMTEAGEAAVTAVVRRVVRRRRRSGRGRATQARTGRQDS